MAGTWGGAGLHLDRHGSANFIESLPSNDEFAETYANAIAANGQLVFGGSGRPGVRLDCRRRHTKLQDIATAAGIEIPQGVVLSTVKAASADGTIVIGQAINATQRAYSFVLKLPASAYGL